MRKLSYLIATSAALVAFLGLSAPTQAYPSIDLLTDSVFQMDGAVDWDWTGDTVSDIGDMNGDGYDDIIVGAESLCCGGERSTGFAYVVFGNSRGGTLDFQDMDLEPPCPNGGCGVGFRIVGGVGDSLGKSVSGAGDVNGDGIPDVVVGAWAADYNGHDHSGAAFVIFGKSDNEDPVHVDDFDNPGNTEGFRIEGAHTYDDAGSSVSNVGDVNGDGLGDVLVGSPRADYQGSESGSSYVIYGKSDNTTKVRLADVGTTGNTDGFRIDGAAYTDRIGTAVSDAGDMDGDGLDDMILSTPYTDYNDRYSSGSTYVVFGKSGYGTIRLRDFRDPGNTQGFRVDGAYANEGVSGSGAGDVNGDGIPDLIIGNGRVRIRGGGSAYVIFSESDIRNRDNLDLLDFETPGNTEGFRIDGEQLGATVSDFDDVNRDGYDDVIYGAGGPSLSDGRGAGTTFVVFGKPDYDTIRLANFGTPENTEGVRINGAVPYDGSGAAVSSAGDFNNDGCLDVIIGAPLTSNNDRPYSGATYIASGCFPRPQVDPVCDGNPYGNDFLIHDFKADTPDTHRAWRTSTLTFNALVCGTSLGRFRTPDEGSGTLTDHVDIMEPPGAWTEYTGPRSGIPRHSYAGKIKGRVATYDENGVPRIEETTATLTVDRLRPRRLGDPLPQNADSCNREAEEGLVQPAYTFGLIIACFAVKSEEGSPVKWHGSAWGALSSTRDCNEMFCPTRAYITLGPIYNNGDPDKPAGLTEIEELTICGYAGRVNGTECGSRNERRRSLHRNGTPSAPDCGNGNGIYDVTATNKDGKVTPSRDATPVTACVEWVLGRRGRGGGREGSDLPSLPMKGLKGLKGLKGSQLGEGLIGRG